MRNITDDYIEGIKKVYMIGHNAIYYKYSLSQFDEYVMVKLHELLNKLSSGEYRIMDMEYEQSG